MESRKMGLRAAMEMQTWKTDLWTQWEREGGMD